MSLERIFSIHGAFNLRRPSPARDYGISPMRMWFAVKGPHGGVSVTLSTAWYLPTEQQSSLEMYTKGYPFCPCEELLQPKWWVVSYHAKAPQYEGQSALAECQLTDGPCYCDGTYLWGQEAWLPGFLHGGTDWLWARLEDYYRFRFEDGPEIDLTPVPRKHPDE